uniref:SpvB/TcaC N-terminal domain-containing protein n=1 Tax=Rhodoferax sp. TaxID=50421 RepID=UPI00272C3233|nr:SpvB/TcaC N-terminal domain-containing protein [Rhodoferax sp.]
MESENVGSKEQDTQGPSSMAAPQVSMPKGGGAIRGLGEKFQTNSANGTASLTVPVPLSKSRSGFQPALSLSHSSGSGNGPFGLGCTLGLPSISRRTDKGVPRYAPFARREEEVASADAAADIFLLSGSEDLVPVCNDDGSGVARDTKGYFVRRYRPRIEGIFSRIESWTRLADGDTHWRTISRDNVLTVYGEGAESRVADPEDGQRIFEWLVCRSYDDRGNAIEYEYAAEGGDGVDISRLNERFRSRSANRYLKRVRYGNRKPVPAVLAGSAAGSRHLPRPHIDSETGWLFEVVLDYGDEPFNHEPDADGFERVSWTQAAPGPRPSRRDPFSVSRSGFEVRTYRLCKRIFVVHRMHEMLGAARTLVRGVHLRYDERPTGTRVTSITQSGYRMLDDGSYRRRSLPALLLHYAESPLDDPAPRNWAVRQLPAESLENLPTGIGGPGYQWTDLDGEGIAGVLATEPGAWYYKPNRGQGRFGPVQVVRSMPVGDGGRSQLIDLDSDGRLEFATLEQGIGGYFDRTADAGWMPFRAFRSFPLVDFADPNVHLADLSGDGLADILITDDQAIIWHPSLGDDGFGEAIRVRVPWNEEGGPRVLLGQADQSVFLADMSGDGLADLVRIRNGEVCYWPSLGYGKFGPKVTMDASPWFDEEGLFDARRLRFADTDGSGPTDVLYAGRKGVKVYLNESGNALSKPRTVCEMVLVEGISLSVVDLLGRGTACLVWSTALPGMAWRPVQYIDLMCGEKPHLLVRSENQLGAETRFEYASSTEFYLADQEAGRPWLTRLPFPVHVIKRMESIDHLSRSRFVTRYAYHDGHYDGVEREFRGFGMVEQWDTEQFEALSEGSTPADNIAAASHVAPVHTKTWFHTGAWLGRERISRQMEDGYFREPGLSKSASRALLLDDTILPRGLTPEEEREACRALKGSMLRQEIYADDAGHPGATPAQVSRARTPYTVTEQNFRIRMLQSRGVNRYAVFFTHANEALTYHYERNPADPRIQHALTLEVDDLGNVLKQAAIGYGRRVSPLSQAWDRNRQTTALLTYTENRVTHAIATPETYRAPLPCEAITYELTGYTATGPAGRYRPTDLVEPDPAAAGRLRHKFAAPEVAYEAIAGAGQRRRPIEWLRTLYRRDDLSGILPLGELQSFALPGETFKLAFTPGLLDHVFRRPRQGQPDEPLLPNPADVLQGQAGDRGGYLQSQTLKADGRFPASDADDHWWLPSGQAFYSDDPADDAATELLRARQHFFLPRRYANPFGQLACVDFDAYDLLMTETRDALGNRVTVNANDYRVLQPRLVSDPNRNQTEVAFDTLGMVVGTAVMGKPLPAPVEGDALTGFLVDLTQAQLDGLFNAPDPHTHAVALLKDASTRIVYDLDRFRRTRQENARDSVKWQPACAATLARETHANAPLQTQVLKIQLNFSYSDGFGREIQKKIQAEPGPVPQRDANGNILVGADGQAITTPGEKGPRWVGSGWTVSNNKGKPIRQFEPFFTDTHRFEFNVRIGVSPVLFYDPTQRVIATLHPNHTYAKVVFDPWQQTTCDVNDTCALRNQQTGDPRTDPDIGGFVAEYFKTQPATWQTWYAQRIGGALGTEERKAAQQAQAHADTPTAAHFDALGRPFLTVARNRVVCPGHDLDGSEDSFATRIEMDIEGNQRAARDAVQQAGDPLGRIVMRSAYDMLGNHIHQQSMEAGARWMLNDVAGKPIRAWDSRGHNFTKTYDTLRRALGQMVRGTSTESDPRAQGRDILIDKIAYGEALPNAEALNLRMRIFRHFDSAGVATNARLDADARPIEAYDFKGNLLCSTRQLLCDYTGIPDWSLNPTLNDEVFVGSVRYDALNRPIQSVAPRSSVGRGKFNVIQPIFNEANFLERMDVWLEREADPGALIDPASEAASPVGVANIDYDAKGKRQRIDYKNGASTTYRYDPLTLRLTQLLTKRRAADFPGDDPRPPVADWPGKQVQNLHYTYDPAGNITHIQDDAQQAVYFRNKRVEPSNDYTYDALYRLIQATGREHLGQSSGSVVHAPNDAGCGGPASADAVGQFAANDGNAMGTYIERYVLDAVGNFLQMQHRGSDVAHPGWTRAYDYLEPSLIDDGSGATLQKNSNRLTRTTLNPAGNTAQPQTYLQDAHGNELRMPHLGGAMPGPSMHWDYKDQLRQTDLGGGGTGFYVYDAAGQRVRKVWEKAPGLIEERLYIGGFEIFRKHGGPVGHDSVTLERETLHVMDDTGRLALVETCTLDTAGCDKSPCQLIRYQFGNHLGSASLELDDLGHIISYEEYAPYGSSTYRAVRSQTEAAKRYRYTGKERDEESGLYYHGARYYADWLGRWTATDPAGLVDGPNPYVYGRSNPLSFTDSTGTQCDPATQSCVDPTLASGNDATLTCSMDDGSYSSSAFASGGFSAAGSLMSSLAPAAPTSVAAQATNSIDDLLTFIHAQSGFEAGTLRPPTFSPRSASPFGTAAHGQATGVIQELQSMGFYDAGRIYSEVRTVNGVVVQIGGTPGGPRGSFNMDIVVARPGTTIAVGDNLTGGAAGMIGDLKYGGGVINPKYGALGSPLETLTGRTPSGPMPAFPEVAAPGMANSARFFAAGGGVFNFAGGAFMLASIDTEHDPGIVTVGKATSGGASLVGGGMMIGGAWAGEAALVALGGSFAAVGGVIAAPIMVYEMRPRGWIAIDPVLMERDTQRFRNGENVNPFCAQCHGTGGALDPNNDWNAGGARRAAFQSRLQWRYLGD